MRRETRIDGSRERGKNNSQNTGDAACANGWAFSSDHLPGGARPDHATDGASIERWFEEARADVFACAHTCRPVLQRFSSGLVANNGAAGLGNFRNDPRGLVTRVACADVASALGAPLYSADVGRARVEAVPLAFDLNEALAAFDGVWPSGSAAAVSYRERLMNGDDGWSPGAADRGGVSCPHLHALVERQTTLMPRIVEELEAHGEKRSHWAWWCFPTDMCGNSEPLPKTKLSSPAAAVELLARGPVADWRKALELICELSEAKGRLVLPAADHGRVASFIPFWEGLEFTPAWLTVVLRRLEALLPPRARRSLAEARGRD